jgi:hypothetical protein
MNGMIGRRQHIVFALTTVALLLTAHALNAQDHGQDCSALVMNQSYSQAFSGGFLNVPKYFEANHLGAPPDGVGIVPTAGAGMITFLPQGQLSGRITLAIGLLGLIQDLPFDPAKSSYSLSLDTTSWNLASWGPAKTVPVCSGTLKAVAPTDVFNFQLLVSPDGQRIEMIHTDIGLAVSLTANRMVTSGCRNNTVNGKYLYNVRGWALAGGPVTFPPIQLLAGYFPFDFSGAMELHPSPFPRPADPGSVGFSDSVSANGTIYPRTGTGSYAIKPDCTGTMTLTDSTGLVSHLELFVDKETGTLYAVNVDTVPGTSMPAFLLGMSMSRLE